VLAWWALQIVGAAAVPVNFRLSAGELRYVLDDSAARAVLVEAGPAAAVAEAVRGRDVRLVAVGDTPLVGAVPFADLVVGAASRGVSESAAVTESDLSLILYTSGTTGRPKGVPRTHRNGAAGAVAHVVQCGYTWGERTLGVMPLYHTMGIHALTSMAAINGCFACQPEWSVEGALRLIEARRLTALYLIPTLFYDLVHAPAFTRARVRSVRKLGYAGAPMLAALTDACVEAFRPGTFVNHYGSTEIYTFSVRPDVASKPGCAGRPGLHSTLRVVQASTERRVDPDETVAAGVKGEIIASLESDEAFAGYWNRPDADARALRDGWYFTGDMGYVDDDGELWVAGRVDDMIISGGENIHPVEVEEVLARHPGVRDVAVVGAPHPRWGEQVVAFVVRAADGPDAGALDAHCQASQDLAGFKRPRRFVFVSELPKTASGKILRRLLRDGQYTEITS
jgi:2-furoate---CoA ligase